MFRLEATAESLIDASSNMSSSLVVSRVRSPINCMRCRVSIRNRRMSSGGTNDGASSPCSNREAIHSLSRTSLFRPGTACMCAALSSHTVMWSSR